MNDHAPILCSALHQMRQGKNATPIRVMRQMPKKECEDAYAMQGMRSNQHIQPGWNLQPLQKKVRRKELWNIYP